jgi:hypothetical protein
MRAEVSAIADRVLGADREGISPRNANFISKAVVMAHAGLGRGWIDRAVADTRAARRSKPLGYLFVALASCHWDALDKQPLAKDVPPPTLMRAWKWALKDTLVPQEES